MKNDPTQKNFLGEIIVNRKIKYDVYNMLVRAFPTEAMSMKSTLFRIWLAKELQVPIEYINYNSLRSAVTKVKKMRPTMVGETSAQSAKYTTNMEFSFEKEAQLRTMSLKKSE